ncbi:MAG TPA: hypothetical protein VMH04_09480 [Candidatus Solibacter sp.]|nr:hypothetical protein [Candidatus Solibacter sp.]
MNVEVLSSDGEERHQSRERPKPSLHAVFNREQCVRKTKISRHHSSDQNAAYIEVSKGTVNPGMGLPQTRGKLQRSNPQRSCTSQHVSEQLPANWVKVFPRARIVLEDESFVVIKNEQDCKAKSEKKRMLGSEASLDP